jgi:hypothetical protein
MEQEAEKGQGDPACRPGIRTASLGGRGDRREVNYGFRDHGQTDFRDTFVSFYWVRTRTWSRNGLRIGLRAQFLGARCTSCRARPVGTVLGAKFGRKPAQNRPEPKCKFCFRLHILSEGKRISIAHWLRMAKVFLAVLRIICILFLAPPHPPGDPGGGSGDTCQGLGPIPARIRGVLCF